MMMKKKPSGKPKSMPGYSKGGVMKKMGGGVMKPVKKMNQGSRRRPAPVEEPKYKDPLLQALEEERRIKEASGDYEEKPKGKKYGGKLKKMASGGKCRGMGMASRGGSYSRNG